MSPLSTTPLPTPTPSPRRPPVPAGILRGVAVLAVIGLAYIFGSGSKTSEIAGKTPIIAFDASFPSPLLRAATPLADGFDLAAERSLAVATGIVTTADPTSEILILLHKIKDESGKIQYFETRYAEVRGAFVAVGDPVARGQKLADSISREASITFLNENAEKKIEISIREFLRNTPFLASPEYAIPPFPAHGAGQLPVLSPPDRVPQSTSNSESP